MIDESDFPRDLGEKGFARRNLRVPNRISLKRLENAALHYLGRFTSSSDSLRRVLMRRALRSAHYYGSDTEEATVWVNEVVAKMKEQGFVNDRTFAEGRINSLLLKGMPLRRIRLELRKKGICEGIIDEIIDRYEEDAETIDFKAAVSLAKRRRLGPFSTILNDRNKREKDMSSLARAGFELDIIKRVMDFEAPIDFKVK